MSPSENKRTKRRKNRKARVVQNDECVESQQKSTVDNEENVMTGAEDPKDATGSTVQPYRMPNSFNEKQNYLCQCECPQSQDDSFEIELGPGCIIDENEDEDSPSSPQIPLWVCSDQQKMTEEEQRAEYEPTLDYLSNVRDLPSFNIDPSLAVNDNIEERSICHCESCNERRVVEAEQAQVQQELRNCWLELKQAVHQSYREAGLSLGETLTSQQVLSCNENKLLSREHLKELLHRLCEQDPHRLFQCLEAQVQLFIVEMRLRLLRLLVSGKSFHSGKPFICVMLEEYAKLCSAAKHLAPVLHELETMHLNRFNITWELVNRYLFQSIIYSDPVLHGSLPDVFVHTRSTNSSYDCTNDAKSLGIKFNDDMNYVSAAWREAQKLIQEYTNEQAAARVKHKDWSILSTHWKVLEDEIFNKPTICNRRYPCEECCGSRCQSSESLASGLLSSADLSPLPERRESHLGNSETASCNQGRRCAVQKNQSKANLVSSLSNTHGGPCRECLQSVGILNDNCYIPTTSPKQATENPTMLGINHVGDSSNGKLSVCPVLSNPNRRVFTNDYNQSLPVHHHCHHNSDKNRNGVSDNQSRLTEQCALHSLCQGQSTTGISPIFNSSSAPVALPLNAFSLSTTTANTVNLQEMNGTSTNHKTACRPVDDEGCDHRVEIGANVKGSGTIDARPCECHACSQLKETLMLPNGPIIPALPPVPHSRTAFPLFSHLTELSQNNAQPLIHPHLYNLQLGKGNIGNSPPTKPNHHIPWSINMTAEEQEALQEQIYIATYGEWDYHADDIRPSLNYQRYGETLNSNFLCPRNPHTRSPVINSNINMVGRRKLTGCGSPVIAHVEFEASDDHLLPPPQSPTKAHLPASSTSVSCTGGTYCHNAMKSGAKRHRHASDSLCSAHSQQMNGDAYSTGKTEVPTVKHTASGTNKEQQTSSRSVHTSTSPMSNASTTNASALQNQNDHQSVTTSTCCDDTDCENHLPEGEESVDDSCSEQSSSTSTSNQRESRVCDCCYCEVFGHGMPAVAPVSKNYPEMRERLRLRLSKRKAESGSAKSQDPLGPAVDNRALEELLSFINGSDSSQNKSKTAKRQKKKKKAEDKIVKQLENCTLQNQENCKSSNYVQNKSKQEHPVTKFDNQNCGNVFRITSSTNNESSKETLTNTALNQTINHEDRSKTSQYTSLVKHNEIIIVSKVSTSFCDQSNTTKVNLLSTSHQLNGQSNITAEKNCVTIRPINGSPPDKVTTEKSKSTEHFNNIQSSLLSKNVISVTSSKDGVVSHITPSKGQKLTQLLSENDQILNCNKSVEVIEQKAAPKINPKNTSTVIQATQEQNGIHNQNTKPSVRSKKNKKKKNCSDDATSLDEVFLPKDIDLENGELDEFEKELEAFKRFCFNSVPLERKEKVNVNLKDIVIKKKSQYGPSGINFSGSSQNQRC